MELAVEELRFSVAGRKACVSLTCREGALLVLRGENGSGKTTTLNAIAGLVPATGSLSLDGSLVPPRAAAWKRFRLGLGYVLQQPAKWSSIDHHTLRQTALWAATMYPVVAAPTARRIADIGERLVRASGVDAPDSSSHGSVGQQRLLQIGLAFMTARAAYLLDEPLVGLDFSRRDEVICRLKELKDLGVPVLVVEHSSAVELLEPTRVLDLRLTDTRIHIEDSRS